MAIECADPVVQNKLFCDYLFDFQSLKDFYTWDPFDSNDWKKALASLEKHQCNRKKLIEVLGHQNKAFGCEEKTLTNIDLLQDEKTFAVITGQQAGLFTGPLLTIYKTLSTIKLTELLNDEYEYKFIPVFWVVSDDHDFDEVNHLSLVNGASQVRRIVYQPEGEYARFPVGTIPVDNRFNAVLEQFSEKTPETEFKASVQQMVRTSYSEARSVADGFCRFMANLFREYGLVVVDPRDPDLTVLAAPVFEMEIGDPEKSTSCVLKTGEQLSRHGYHQQIHLRPGHLNIFLEIDGRRCSISEKDERFQTDRGSYSREEILKLLRSSPERFSPNVVLRPIVRSHLLPTAAYIGGPAEISYYAQLKDVFSFFGVPQPIVYPRVRGTLIEGKIRRILDRHSIDPMNVYTNSDGVVNDIVKGSLPETFRTVFQETEEDMKRFFGKIRDAVTPIDSSLNDLVTRSRNRLAHDIEKIEKKVIQARKKSEEVIVQQIEKVKTNLFPNGEYQERVLNIVPFLILYGPDFIHHLYNSIDINTKRHQMIDI